MREGFINDGQTTLAAAIGSSDTSIAVADGSVGPVDGQFRVRIDEELILANSVGASPWAVLARGVEGTTATTHTAGAAVAVVLTAAGLLASVEDRLRAPMPAEALGSPAAPFAMIHALALDVPGGGGGGQPLDVTDAPTFAGLTLANESGARLETPAVSLTIATQDQPAGGADAGAIYIQAGASQDTYGGSVTVQAGGSASYEAGKVTIQAGTGDEVAGGDVNINAGGSTTNAGGAVYVQGGSVAGSGEGGAVSLVGGDGADGESGGGVTVRGGASAGGGDTGTVDVHGGNINIAADLTLALQGARSLTLTTPQNLNVNVGGDLAVNGLPGFTGAITAATLVGKTITIQNGIIVGFA